MRETYMFTQGPTHEEAHTALAQGTTVQAFIDGAEIPVVITLSSVKPTTHPDLLELKGRSPEKIELSLMLDRNRTGMIHIHG